MSLIFKNTEMSLYAHANDMFAYRVCIALHIKDIKAQYVLVDPENLQEEFLEKNPYASSPTLVNRDLVIYNSDIILNYLDERFPHPPLLPIEPIERTKLRLRIYRAEQDIMRLIPVIQKSDKPANKQKAREIVLNNLIASIDEFVEDKFLGGESISLYDCIMIPFLSILDDLEIDLPRKQASAIYDYPERMLKVKAVAAATKQIADAHLVDDEADII